VSYVQNVRKKIELVVDRLDGGLNQKDGPQSIDDSESPDCYNVVFSDQGTVQTREGTSYFNTSAIETGSNVADGIGTYKNSTMVAWFGGTMFRSSGTTFVAVSGSTGGFTTGAVVTWQTFQNILFCSDGTNGPYRWEGSNSFYKMGMYAMSAPIAASNVAGNLAAGTWYYAIAPVNSHAVEGPLGSMATVTNGVSAVIGLTGIPLGTALAGTSSRYVYRASATIGPWYRVGTIADNVTTVYTDTMGAATGVLQATAATSTTSPKPFTCIALHKERLWMPDKDNLSLLRYTDFTNPFVSDDLNFVEVAEGDDTDIKAIGVQNDLVTSFKDNSIHVCTMSDPSDDTTLEIKKSPANYGIVSSQGFVATDNGLIFAAKQFGRLVGFGYLSGLDLVQTQDQFLLSKTITKKIENMMSAVPTSLYSRISLVTHDNAILVGFPLASTSTRVDGALWFDIGRLVKDQDTDPGSWVPWSGFVGANCFVNHVGTLYGGYSDATGKVLKYNNSTFVDANAGAINSYWWSKELASDGDLASWIKDFRFLTVWYDLIGSYDMYMRVRLDGEQGVGNPFPISLTPDGTLWNGSTWGGGVWNGSKLRKETQVPIGPLLGKRIQVRFDNNNTAGRGFKVHQFKVTYNPRRQR
jgi:hypothetical protein